MVREGEREGERERERERESFIRNNLHGEASAEVQYRHMCI